MFSTIEKRKIAEEIEKLLLSFKHPEMPEEKPHFSIHIDGKEPWSWADIEPNWKFPVHAQGGGRMVITFGKYKGETIEEISIKDPDYLQWLYDNVDNAALQQEIEKCIDLES